MRAGLCEYTDDEFVTRTRGFYTRVCFINSRDVTVGEVMDFFFSRELLNYVRFSR